MATRIQTTNEGALTIPAILSIVCVFVSFASGAALGLLAAVAAIFFGLMGVALAVLPQKRGGMLSVVSIVLGLIGIIAAVFKLVF
jgi:hypothetical protein